MAVRNELTATAVRQFDATAHPDRINLGCGFDRHEGYLNVDFVEAHSPDLLADIRSLDMLPSDRYVDVLAHDCLEHLDRTQTDAALAEWFRITAPGGRIEVRTPNLAALTGRLSDEDTVERHRRIIQDTFGTQAYSGDYHLTSFTDLTLIDHLSRAGFRNIVVELEGTNFHAVGIKPGLDHRGSEVALAWSSGFYPAENADGAMWRWCGETGEILLVNSGATSATVRVTGRVAARARAHLQISAPIEVDARIPAHGLSLRRSVALAPGPHRIRFRSDASPEEAPGDQRSLVFRMWDFTVTEAVPGTGVDEGHGSVPPPKARRIADVASLSVKAAKSFATPALKQSLRLARDRLVPDAPRSRARVAHLESNVTKLAAQVDGLEAERNQLQESLDAQSTFAEVRDRTDNDRIKMILAFTLRPDSNCLDVGCHEGSMLADMLRNAPAGKHLAYEPIPYMHAALVERFPSVDIRQAALSNVKGESTFKHVRDLPGYSGLRERTYPHEVDIETITVQTERLDDNLPKGWAPDLIKIDVEGAEQLVIEGAMKTISRHRPTIIFEHGRGGSDHYGTGPADIYRLLHTEAGLRIYDLDGNGPYSLAQLEDEYARCERWQWVAHA